MKSKFAKFMVIYIIIGILGTGFLWYKLWGIVDIYEQELPDYAMQDYVNSFDEEHYIQLVESASDIGVTEFENAQKIIEKYGNICIDGKKLGYKKKTGKYTNSAPVYSVTADDKEIVQVYLKENKKGKGRKKWAVDKEETSGINLKGKEKVYISAPDGYKVYINGTEVKKDYITGSTDEAQLLENVKKYISDIPKVEVYTVDGLFEKPEVKITDSDDNEVEYNVNGNSYSCGFSASQDFASANDSWIIEMINNYALYLSNDGSFSNLTPYLYPDDSTEGLKSKLSTIGVSWYTDHTGTSLSDQKVSDYKLYSDNCFSCIVTFKQTVRGIGGSGDKTVVNDNKLICIFVKYNDEWKWAGMNTLEIDK